MRTIKDIVPDMDEVDFITDTYPSICHGCINARRVNSQDEGYIGCISPMKHYKTFDKDIKRIEAEVIMRGMVDLHSKPFMYPTGSGASHQLITRETKKCPNYNI